MSVYRYAYVGDGMKVHILEVDHGILCMETQNYGRPQGALDMDVAPSDGWWDVLVAAHTLCARCRKQFEGEIKP